MRPCLLISRRTSHRLRRACGSSAAVGSSRNTTSGSWTSAQAMDRRCAWPPESFSTWTSALSSSPTSSSIVVGLAGGDAVQGAERLQLLARGQPLEERRRLQLDADPRQQRGVPRPGGHAEHRHLPLVGLPQPLDDLQRGRLPRAVRAEDPEELALLDGERDAVHGADVPVALAQARHLDRVCHAEDDKGGRAPGTPHQSRRSGAASRRERVGGRRPAGVAWPIVRGRRVGVSRTSAAASLSVDCRRPGVPFCRLSYPRGAHAR